MRKCCNSCAQPQTHSFSALLVRKQVQAEGENADLPVLEFKSSVPADATTFKKSGNSRNPKPQKSTCMIVHVQRRATAWIPVLVFLRSLGAFRLRSACHIQFYYPRLLGRWSPVGEVHCWDVSAPRIPWRTCILQTGVGCSLSCYELRRLMCAAARCPVRGGIRQERYTASRPSSSHPSTLNSGMWSETGLFTSLTLFTCLFDVTVS